MEISISSPGVRVSAAKALPNVWRQCRKCWFKGKNWTIFNAEKWGLEPVTDCFGCLVRRGWDDYGRFALVGHLSRTWPFPIEPGKLDLCCCGARVQSASARMKAYLRDK